MVVMYYKRLDARNNSEIKTNGDSSNQKKIFNGHEPLLEIER